MRTLPVAKVLNELIAEYVGRFHPPRPAEGQELEDWLDRNLVVSTHSDAPWRVVVDRRWANALLATGLDFDSVGFYVKPHLLRKSGSTVIGRSRKVPGDVWSSYLGHKTKLKDGASRTTQDTYFLQEDKRLKKCAKVLNSSLKKLGRLSLEDGSTVPELVTVHDAGVLLGVSRTTLHRWVGAGVLVPAYVPHDLRPSLERGRTRWGPTTMFRVDDLEHLSAQLHEDAMRWCSQKEAAARLGLSRHVLPGLVRKGLLVQEESSGGRRQIDSNSVERVAELLRLEALRAPELVGVRETAGMLKVSEVCVRALDRSGRLERVRPLVGDAVWFSRSSVERELTARGGGTGFAAQAE